MGSGHEAAVFTTVLLVVIDAASTLPSFAMWSAFPTSDYYEGSVPLRGHRQTTCPPIRPTGCREGWATPKRFPRSLMTGR